MKLEVMQEVSSEAFDEFVGGHLKAASDGQVKTGHFQGAIERIHCLGCGDGELLEDGQTRNGFDTTEVGMVLPPD